MFFFLQITFVHSGGWGVRGLGVEGELHGPGVCAHVCAGAGAGGGGWGRGGGRTDFPRARPNLENIVPSASPSCSQNSPVLWALKNT